MGLLNRGDGAIFYEVNGDGPPLVILRGLGRTIKHWLGYENVLARHAQVITMDLRGIGSSSVSSRFKTSVYDMADDVVAVLDKLKIDKAHILGVSLGGMVTLAQGLKHPGRCQSLVVVNTSIGGQRTLRLSPKALKAILSSGWVKGEQLQRDLVDVLVGRDLPDATRADIARRYAEIARRDGIFVDTVVKQLVAAARFTPIRELKTMKVPTLVVYGTHDLFVPTANSIKLARLLPNAKLQALEGAGHEASLDKGSELSTLVETWISEHR